MVLLNAKKSKKDERDIIFDNLFKTTDIVDKCDYTNHLLPIRNQGEQGTCYAQSAACVKEWQEKKNKYLSPQYIYNNRDYWNNNALDGTDVNEDYGMEGRDVMRIMKNIGVCDEDIYPYGTLETANNIPDNIHTAAKSNIIKGYARIYTIDSLKEALYKNGPCLIAFPVFNYTDQMWVKNQENDKLLGGHAMTVVGFDDKLQYFKIRNSWGESWGDNGYTYYYYKDWDSHWEAWTTIDDISNNIIPSPDTDKNHQNSVNDLGNDDTLQNDSQSHDNLHDFEDKKTRNNSLQTLCEKLLGIKLSKDN